MQRADAVPQILMQHVIQNIYCDMRAYVRLINSILYHPPAKGEIVVKHSTCVVDEISGSKGSRDIANLPYFSESVDLDLILARSHYQ